MNELELTGQVRTHIHQLNAPRVALQARVSEAFSEMKFEAEKVGITIYPVSSFRDYKTQLRIWNHKMSGKRDIFSPDGILMDKNSLSTKQLVFAILRWSALPGASRHHWGTEIDIVDMASIPKDYHIQLLPHEFEGSGPFRNLKIWMDENIQRFGFFQPYKRVHNGVSSEPWHISFRSISEKALEDLTLSIIEKTTSASSILGKVEIIQELPNIFEKFVRNINN